MEVALASTGNGLPTAWLSFLARALTTIFLTGAGTMLCTTVGTLAYPVGGVGAVLGAVGGFFSFLLIGCCTTSLWREMPFLKRQHGQAAIGGGMFEGLLSVNAHPKLKLLLTLHRVENVHVQGRMMSNANLYCEVVCGTNPLKKTCVNQDGIFNESFKLEVRPQDENIAIKFKDQEVFGSGSVGYALIDVDDDIWEPVGGGAKFPKHKKIAIQAEEGDSLSFHNKTREKDAVKSDSKRPVVVVSITHLEAITQEIENQLNEDIEKQDLEGAVVGSSAKQSENYGTLQYLSRVEYDHKHDMVDGRKTRT